MIRKLIVTVAIFLMTIFYIITIAIIAEGIKGGRFYG